MQRLSQRAVGRGVAICLLSLFLFAPSTPGQEAADKYVGRPLSEALRALQARGLRIVFSSETVTADMRVVAEPRARPLRQALNDLLVPHGLKAESGPGSLIIVVRAKRAEPSSARKPRAEPPATVSARQKQTGPAATYNESVTVRPPWREHAEKEAVSDVRLGPGELHDLRSILADDPIRAAQALPGVAAGDDFRSEFSMRGSPFRQVGVVVDGVATPWLLHSAYGRGDSASTAMFDSSLIKEARLQAGAFPRRQGTRLGPQLGLVLREGSRVENGFRAAISGTGATFVAEGPMGGTRGGSWLVNARQSYRDWPVRRPNVSDGSVFGFRDLLAKLVYDVRPSQQVSVTVLNGVSALDGIDEGPAGLGEGTNRTTVLNLGWRSTPGAGLVITQRAYMVAHQFLDKGPEGGLSDRREDGEIAYRVDGTRAMFGGIFETGAHTARLGASRHGSLGPGDQPLPLTTAPFNGRAWIHSGYVNFTWHPAPRLTLGHGLRVSDFTLIHRGTLDDWIVGEWAFRTRWTLNGSAGLSHQPPEFHQVLGSAGTPGLRPERAAHLDIGLERRFARSVRSKATFYQRGERDVLREPDTLPRLVDDVLVEPYVASRYENALTGVSRGIELLLERRTATGLSGWVAYSYGKTRFTDVQRKEAFWGDFDQRHAVNIFAVYRRSESMSLAATFRGGSNFPVPGYLNSGHGGLFAGSVRNEVRLPLYARLDLRANRAFTSHGRRFTLFVEVLNVLNRTNLGVANGRVNAVTGEATGFTRTLFQRLPSAGLVVAF